MAINCIYDPTRKKFGYGDEFANRLKKVWNGTPSKAEFTNTVRRLGVDDTRMVNITDETGARMLGKNLTDVKNLNLSKGGVDRTGVVVRMPSPNGEQFFMSNGKPNSAPTRWIRDEFNGRVKANPEWDQINVNVTGLARYKKDTEGVWRISEDGDGSFLNIQNPIKGEREISEIVEKGYDAIQLDDGGYRLIDEASQTTSPKKVTAPPDKSSVYSETIETPPSNTEVAEKLIKDYQIPSRIAYSIAGGLAGSYADEYDEYGGTFWGGALGLALGAPSVRGKFKGVYHRINGTKGKDFFDKLSATTTVREREQLYLEQALSHGYKGDVTDPEAVQKFVLAKNEMENKRLRGEGWRSRVFDNEYFRSGFGLLSKMGKTGKDLIDIFRSFESGPQEMFARFGQIQRELFGVQNAKEIFKSTQISFIKQFDLYNKLTDKDALQAFGDAVDRIISSGGRIEDGKLAWDSSPTANIRYADELNREIDQRLLTDPEAGKVVETMKRYFDEVAEDHIKTLRLQIDKELTKVGDISIREELEAFVASKLSYSQYKKGFSNNGDKLKRLKKIERGEWGVKDMTGRHRDLVETLIGMSEDKIRFENLRGKYIPQKFSKVKEAAERKKWEKEYASKLEGLKPTELNEAWSREKAHRINAFNNEKYKKLTVTEDGLDVEVEYFATPLDAKAKLNLLFSEIPEESIREDVLVSMLKADESAFIKSEMVNGKMMYYLDTPSSLRELLPNGLYEEANIARIGKADTPFVLMNTFKEADFFDRPRNVNIPPEFKELDLEELTRFYTDDMGIRSKAIRNGMYNNYQVEDNWIRPMEKEVAGQFSTPEKLNTKLDEVKSWFSLMQNERKMSAVAIREGDIERIQREAVDKAKNDNFFNTLAKLATFPFNYATTLYAPFTPMILGPFLTSWKSVAGVYKDAIFAPKQFAKELKAWTDEIEHMNVLQKKFESLAPEYNRLYKDDILGDPTEFRRKMADFADKATEFSANLSFARAFGVDPENLGILRLVAGNMLDVSGAEAGMVLMATFRHLSDLSKAYKEIDKGVDAVTINGKRYTKKGLERQFNDLGVTEVDTFVKNETDFDTFTRSMKGEGTTTDISPEYYSQLVRIMNNSVDQYHGRTRLSRPLKWMENNWGRALSRYSVYAQNFGVQTTSRRIYQPLRDWSDQYKMNDESVPLFKLAYWGSTGNTAKFKEVFGDQWEGAYNDFPVDAVNNFFKVFGALSVAKAMVITRAGVMDLTGIATNEALGNEDYEVWRNINKQTALGNYADTGEPFYISDIFNGDVQGFDLFKMFTSMIELTVRTGFLSRYAQIPIEDLKFTGGGIMEMTPVTSYPNDVFQRAVKIRQTNWVDMPETAAKEALDFSLLRFTPFGTFYDMRQGINNFVFQKPKNRGVKFVDSQTGIDLDISYYEP